MRARAKPCARGLKLHAGTWPEAACGHVPNRVPRQVGFLSTSLCLALLFLPTLPFAHRHPSTTAGLFAWAVASINAYHADPIMLLPHIMLTLSTAGLFAWTIPTADTQDVRLLLPHASCFVGHFHFSGLCTNIKYWTRCSLQTDEVVLKQCGAGRLVG